MHFEQLFILLTMNHATKLRWRIKCSIDNETWEAQIGFSFDPLTWTKQILDFCRQECRDIVNWTVDLNTCRSYCSLTLSHNFILSESYIKESDFKGETFFRPLNTRKGEPLIWTPALTLIESFLWGSHSAIPASFRQIQMAIIALLK